MTDTQIILIVSFVFVVFGLYKLLVRTKDATIELLIRDVHKKVNSFR